LIRFYNRMKITRHTLDWNLPLLPAITQRLLDGANGDFIDLSSALVIVPTVQSGRRLREALALAVAQQGRGLFPPEIVTPDLLLGQAIKDQAIASEASATAAWVTVLGAIDCTHFDALFPIAPEQTTGWQIGMAQRLMQLRNELGEAGLDFTLAAQRSAEAGHEPERWRQLARLEGLYLDQLKTRELQDPKQGRRDAALTYTAPHTSSASFSPPVPTRSRCRCTHCARRPPRFRSRCGSMLPTRPSSMNGAVRERITGRSVRSI
jgi:ATP-dependent helicase/nuclease subunit B